MSWPGLSHGVGAELLVASLEALDQVQDHPGVVLISLHSPLPTEGVGGAQLPRPAVTYRLGEDGI